MTGDFRKHNRVAGCKLRLSECLPHLAHGFTPSCHAKRPAPFRPHLPSSRQVQGSCPGANQPPPSSSVPLGPASQADRFPPPFPVVPLPSVSVPLPNPLSVSTPITPVMEASSSPVVFFPAFLQVIPAYRKTRPVQAFSVLQRYKIKTRLSSVSGYFFRLFLPYDVK